MKSLFVVLGFLLVPGTVHCQPGQAASERMITRMLASGGYDGGEDKQLDRIGDAAAVVVAKIFGEKTLGPTDVQNALDVIHLSFSAPTLVETAEDRNPRATLFVLRSLNSITTDRKLKEKIAEERKYVLDQVAKSQKNDTR